MPGMANFPRSARLWFCLPLAVAVIVCGCGQLRLQVVNRLAIRKEIDAMLAGGRAGLGVVDTGGSVLWSRLAAFYDDRHRAPVWSTRGHLRTEAEQLLAAIGHAGEAGLTPS